MERKALQLEYHCDIMAGPSFGCFSPPPSEARVNFMRKETIRVRINALSDFDE